MLKLVALFATLVSCAALPLHRRAKRQQVPLPLYPQQNQLYTPYTMGHSSTAFNPFQFPNNQQPPLLPFQHVVGFTQTADWGSKTFIDGELDVPIVKDGYYYPGYIGGDFMAGTPGFNMEYGHAINGVNPFGVDFASLHHCIIMPERCPNPIQDRLPEDLIDPRDEFAARGMDSKRILLYRPVAKPQPLNRG